MNFILRFDALLVKFLKTLTSRFIHTKLGQLFLSLSLAGPFTFLPTVWEAWFAPNIDALRTLTWPLLIIINCSVLLALCYNGDWRIRLSIVMWIFLTFLVSLAAVLR